MTEISAPDEEFTELVDADFPRMDLVGKAANGTQFFIAKSAAPDAARGLFDPAFVRDLIAKSAPTPKQETVTMSGSLAAIAAVIHGAPVRQADAAAVDVAKADVAGEDLDVQTVLAEPDTDVPGDVDVPGSPAWEAVDAATACKWTSILSRVGHALAVMAQREMLEAAAGDEDSAMAAFDLEDAMCAIDYAISVLAPYAAGEHAEAVLGAEALEAVGKALAAFDVAPLELVEGLAPVAKAGRTLSAANEHAIRGAVEALQQVLASLPAPVDDSGQPVAKQTQETVMQTVTPTVPDAAAATMPAEVTKAAPEAQLAVYTADGVLFGVVAPDAVMPIAAPEAPEGAAEQAAEEAAETPAIADGEDAEVIPGTSTVASPAADEDEVMKAAQAGFGPLLAEALAPIAKQLGEYAGLATVVKGLQEQMAHLAAMPDDRKSPLLNGAGIPGAQPQAAAPDGLAQLRKAAEDAPAGVERDTANTQYAIASIKQRFTLPA